MTTLLLVRHAAHDWIGRGVPGRLAGVALNPEGQRQAAALVGRLRDRHVEAIYSSPQQRARETAGPLVGARGLPLHIAEAFDEIDFGEWTGRSLQELEADGERWHAWVEHRSTARAPGGEGIVDVQQRAMAGIEHLRRLHPSETVVVLSHGDVIKAAVAGFLGISLDHLERFDIAPVSLTVIETGTDWFQVKMVNCHAA